MAEVVDKTKVEVPENQNTAKQLAQAMKGKVVILVCWRAFIRANACG